MGRTFAAAMIVVALYCASRLVTARLARRHTELDADGLHVAMGAAMAGMLVPRLSLLPGSVWEIVFGVAALWFAGQATLASRATDGGSRCRYPVPHLVECVAMLYMFLAMPASRPIGPVPGNPMPGMLSDAGSFPALAMVFALFMLGHIVWSADRLTSMTRFTTAVPARSATPDPGRNLVASDAMPCACPQDASGASGGADIWPRRPARGPVLAPRLAACYKIVMSLAMGYMLISMF